MADLTYSDIVMAAILAWFITWTIGKFVKIYRIIGQSKLFSLQEDIKDDGEYVSVLQRCAKLFPKDIVSFKGKIFKKGMQIRVLTNQHKTIEGKLVGMNSEDVICIITSKYIIAHEMSNISDIINVEEN